MSGGYSPPEQKCPYCGEVCEADYVDVGVGLVQCGPYHCSACGATEAGAYDDKSEDLARIDRATGWFRPGEPPGTSANMLDGRLATASETLDAYQGEFSGGRWQEPGAVERWLREQRRT